MYEMNNLKIHISKQSDQMFEVQQASKILFSQLLVSAGIELQALVHLWNI